MSLLEIKEISTYKTSDKVCLPDTLLRPKTHHQLLEAFSQAVLQDQEHVFTGGRDRPYI